MHAIIALEVGPNGMICIDMDMVYSSVQSIKSQEFGTKRVSQIKKIKNDVIFQILLTTLILEMLFQIKLTLKQTIL